MPLSRRDLDEIRHIVREEIKRALIGRRQDAEDDHRPRAEGERLNTEAARRGRILIRAMGPPQKGELREVTELRNRRAREQQERDRRAAARAARPIPDTPFIDLYDARRLLKGTGATANAWIRRGRLTRTRKDGRVQLSRAQIDAIVAETKKR